MSELCSANFADLTTRLFVEPGLQDALFELPRRRWHLPGSDWPDMSVKHFGHLAGNPSGPAAGPHTQMAQNILLSYVAGGRILELKTVQVNDRLTIPRPCIDMATAGYNVEWSQELTVEQSIREYVAGAMLVEMFRRNREATGGVLEGAAGEALYDVSVGYDLAGIKSAKVGRFLEAMRDAGAWIDDLRGEIPRAYKQARDAEYATQISSSITLSTFHGCPPEEIESIARFLIGECDFDLVIKMNPPTLGRERLEYLLHDVMGYNDVSVNPAEYESALSFDDSTALYRDLATFAASRGRHVGFKFTNTLEVLNDRGIFSPDNEMMYLSGPPLHVIALDLLARFRQAAGPEAPVSFSAGIDKANFPLAAAAGIVPVTVCSDLLRPGGYGRLSKYLLSLRKAMKQVGAVNMDQYILRAFEQEEEAERRAEATEQGRDAKVRQADLLNTAIIAERARDDERYRAANNSRPPKRGDSCLETFDCIACEKCVPVCPNAAMFTYPLAAASFEYQDLIVAPDGGWTRGETHTFEIAKKTQIANYADFCNECGNCDTFCPERGGPYICKPSFHGSEESWRAAAPRDGYFVRACSGGDEIMGRVDGVETTLRRDESGGAYVFRDGVVELTLDADDFTPLRVTQHGILSSPRHGDMRLFHTLRLLLEGVTDESRINMANAGRFSRD